MASLKRKIGRLPLQRVVAFPWSKDHGLIEAAHSPGLSSATAGNFHGRKIMASLKLLTERWGDVGGWLFPWSKDHGLIEAWKNTPGEIKVF